MTLNLEIGWITPAAALASKGCCASLPPSELSPPPSRLRAFAVNPLLFLVTFQPLHLIIDPSVRAKAVGLWSRIFNMTSS